MTKPIPLDDFVRLPPVTRASVTEGLSAAIDEVAARASESHRFLRYGWFDAALAAYGGTARTLVVEEEGEPALALPLVPAGPRALKLATIPGSYWPFRSFPLAEGASPGVLRTALAALGEILRGVRIGPVYDGDPAAAALIATAIGSGWVAIDRFVADSWLLDIAAAARATGSWPRTSTLKKNRFQEKHLATQGALGWYHHAGSAWPAAFDDLAAIERASWITSRTDGCDAKFTETGHGAFWRTAAADPVLAGMMRSAVLTVDGRPAAFAFDIDTGSLKYAIANSYDPAFAKQSPGKLVDYRSLIEAMGRGITLVDWGAGDSGYKQVIGAHRGSAIRDWLLLRPGWPALLGRLFGWAWRRSGNPR